MRIRFTPQPEPERPTGGGDIPPPTKTREGDQQLPLRNGSEFIQDLVIVDIEERREIGIKRYGTALQPFNGRDALQDAYEEAMDLCMYLKQLIVERDGKRICPACGKFRPETGGAYCNGYCESVGARRS